MKKIILTIVIILFLSGLFAFSWFYLSLSGGLSGWISSLKQAPDWNSNKITLSRNKVNNEINESLKEIQNQLNFNVHGSAFHDECVKGAHTWMRSDPYAYECYYKVTNFYSFNYDFREKMTELEYALISNGWAENFQENPKQISKMLSEYYDDIENTNYGRTGLVSSLPSVTLYKNYNKYNKAKLNIEYAQKETTRLDSMEYSFSNSVRSNQIYNQKSQVDFKNIFESATKNDKYFITISIEQTYFSN